MKISVALCTYNGEKFLKEQIDSILNQNLSVDEIVVCDDGSTDSTIPILKSYEKKFPEIFKIHQNGKNLRSVKNFEKAISLCENEIIFLSDQDDIWLPEKVEKYVDYFHKNPDISVLCSNGYGIDEEGETLDIVTIWDVPELVRKKEGDFNYFENIAFVGNFATGAAMAIRKNFLNEVIPFPEIMDFHHDEWMALISSHQNKFALLDEKLFKYRVHAHQQVGGVFYKNSEKKKNKLIRYHSNFIEKKDFDYYKKLLKRYSQASQKHSQLFAQQKHLLFYELKESSKHKFEILQKEALEKFPFRFRILSVIDNIKGKRRIEE